MQILERFFLLVVMFLIIVTGYFTYSYSKQFEYLTNEIVKTQNISDLSKNNLKNLSEKITFGIYKNKDKIKIKELNKKLIVVKDKINFYLYLYVISFFLLLFSYFLVSLHLFNIFASLASIFSLLFGIFTPIFMVIIHKEFSLVGDVVLSFESKSLYSSILKLFEIGDYAIAAVILVFSILIPIVKTFSLLLISIFKDTKYTHKLVMFFKHIGKWSMIDVFVIAVLLVFLSANKGEVSKAEIEAGTYMFLIYVLFSMILTLSISKIINLKKL